MDDYLRMKYKLSPYELYTTNKNGIVFLSSLILTTEWLLMDEIEVKSSHNEFKPDEWYYELKA